MIDLDHELQERLNEVENGTSPQKSVANLPQDTAELRSLIHLAAAVHDVPHPNPSPLHTQDLQQRIVQASREMKRNGTSISRRSFNAWMVGSGFAAVAAMLLFLLAAAIGTGVWLYGSPQARAATLQTISGAVEISPDGVTWQPAQTAATLHGGWAVRTGPDGRATLAFYDGSRTTLGHNAQLGLTQIDGRWGGAITVKLHQTAGVSTHQVIPFKGRNSQFVVNTPAGQASVHGTTFSVAVSTQGRASFAVEAGEVEVTNASQSVAVFAGQATFASSNEAPLSPVYQFSLVDELTSVEGDMWSMGGVSFRVVTETIILGDPQIGDIILARGRILENGWVTDLIQASPDDDDLTFQFSGIVEDISEESWVVNGVEILVNEVTKIDDDIAIGDPVRVTYTLIDGGRWLALEIENLAFEVPPTPLPTVVNCTGADPQPRAQTLADKYGITYDEIMGWFCQGFGFGEIDLAYNLSQESGLPVSEIFELRRNGLGWGEIRDILRGTPTVTLTPTPWITPTATLTITLTATPPITVTATPTPQPTMPADCTGAEPQPKGQTLAERYNVPYEEIMGWFCQGFGFGEIDLAYSLSLESGVPVADIFAMKASGMGWGEIRQQLLGKPGPPIKNPGKDKDNDPGNGNGKGRNPNPGDGDDDPGDDVKGPPQPGNPTDKSRGKGKDNHRP